MALRTAIHSGAWNDPATWDTGVPVGSDTWKINSGVTVTLSDPGIIGTTGLGDISPSGKLVVAPSQPVIQDATLTAPPVGAVPGERFIVASPATGAWAGWENKIAYLVGVDWQSYVALDGWLVYDMTNDKCLIYHDAAWHDVAITITDAVLATQETPQTIGDTGHRLTKLWATDLDVYGTAKFSTAAGGLLATFNGGNGWNFGEEMHINWYDGTVEDSNLDLILWRADVGTFGLKRAGTNAVRQPVGFSLSSYFADGGVNKEYGFLGWNSNNVFTIQTVGTGDGISQPMTFLAAGGQVYLNATNFMPITSLALGRTDGDHRWSTVFGGIADFTGAGSFGGDISTRSGTYAGISALTYADNAYPIIAVRRGRGTPAVPTRILQDFELGSFAFGGNDNGGSLRDKARLTAFAAEDWGNTVHLGTYFGIFTTSIGAVEEVERLRIMAGVNIGGVTDPGPGGLMTTGNLGFFGHAAHAQPLKASHNNWASLSDVVAALVEIGILDTA